jgi:hypothetical protein
MRHQDQPSAMNPGGEKRQPFAGADRHRPLEGHRPDVACRGGSHGNRAFRPASGPTLMLPSLSIDPRPCCSWRRT